MMAAIRRGEQQLGGRWRAARRRAVLIARAVYRDNEASRVGAVLERAQVGDADGMIAAALELWLAPEDRAPEADPMQAEVWAAIVAAGAVDAAVAAALSAIRAGQLLRPHAYVDVSEAIGDASTQLELAERALDAGWPGQVYLGAPLLRLLEAERAELVRGFIARHQARLRASTPAWTVIAVLLMMTGLGSRADVVRWIDGWWMVGGVPMWVLQCHAVATGASEMDLIDLADRAVTQAVPDVTLGYFAAVPALFDLRGRRYLAFRERMAAHGGLLAQLAALGGLAHPVARYLARMSHALALDADSATVSRDDTRPAVYRQIDGRLRALAASPARMASLLPLFDQLLDAQPGSPEVARLSDQMRRSRLSELAMLRPVWSQLVAYKSRR